MKDGAWRNKSSLEMGFNSKRNSYAICPYCNFAVSITDKTVGIVCSECNKYFSVEKRYSVDDIYEQKGVKLLSSSSSFHVPNRKLLKFREGMERKAYEWRDKQLEKRKTPNYKPTRHGPINEKTGEHRK